MSLKKKIFYPILIFLLITITYDYYYDYLYNILDNNCERPFGEFGSDIFLLHYKATEGFYRCSSGYYYLAVNTYFTLPLYILFLWLTVVPFTIYIFNLKKENSFLKSNKFYFIGLIILVLIITNSYFSTYTGPTTSTFSDGFPLHGRR